MVRIVKVRHWPVVLDFAAGLVRNGDAGQLGNEVIGAVVSAVRPESHRSAWQLPMSQHEQITTWVGNDLTW